MHSSIPGIIRCAVYTTFLGASIVLGDCAVSRMRPPLTTPPTSSDSYRWLDVSGQRYSDAYCASYEYSDAAVIATHEASSDYLRVRITASDLKPNFAYQVKIAAEADNPNMEAIGYKGRWWQEEWLGDDWGNGWNLNNKGTGITPTPNDLAYEAGIQVLDASSPSGRRYRYTSYFLFGCFVTDGDGSAVAEFVLNNSYHVLWKTTQRSRVEDDGTIINHVFSVPAGHPAYEDALPETEVALFLEWERLPKDTIRPSSGHYQCQLMLTEESFHEATSGAGFWAAALVADIDFSIGALPDLVLSASDSIVAPGTSLSLSALGSAVSGVTLQWYHNGQAIQGASGEELHLSDVSPTDSGVYYLVAENTFGHVSSLPVPLIVDDVGFTQADIDVAVAGSEARVSQLEQEMAAMYTKQELQQAISAAVPDGDGDGFTDAQEQQRGTDPTQYVLKVYPGWNLVSLARVPDDNTIDAIFGDDVADVGGDLWIWDGDGYQRTRDLEPLRGHWLLWTGEAAELEIPLTTSMR